MIDIISGSLKGLIDLNDKKIATLRLTASLAMTVIFSGSLNRYCHCKP
ncbi:MAG: hypothetical protein IJR44_01850 [Neisseriaceae bacterium]|nr:hypothetical protein [Neisseriaceae bacterium]